MLKKLLLNLQLFADGGGDGGDGGSASQSTGETLGKDNSGEKEEIPAFIPEKAKKYYQKAMEKQKGSTTNADSQNNDNAQTTNEQGATDEVSYDDFIKSHKEEHEAYIKKTMGERLKKYKGIEENLGKHKAILETVAQKYGVSPDDENFLETLSQKVDEDDSYYDNYAMEHDISAQEARRIVTMERKARQFDAQEQERQRQEQMRQHIMVLRQNAEKTKAQFPDFDLETEMQDERFRRLCAANNGDTTAAFMACHYNEILTNTVQRASKKIQEQTAQAVASNKARPIENGLSSQAPSVVEQDFRNMNLQQIRKFAEEQRRKQTGR
ncbi:MAG: hypothetical protein E7391_04220 [Ruminococcaceae bacterium]|nr:hypothetical protein [Oscillospiraceae bacterium]